MLKSYLPQQDIPHLWCLGISTANILPHSIGDNCVTVSTATVLHLYLCVSDTGIISTSCHTVLIYRHGMSFLYNSFFLLPLCHNLVFLPFTQTQFLFVLALRAVDTNSNNQCSILSCTLVSQAKLH